MWKTKVTFPQVCFASEKNHSHFGNPLMGYKLLHTVERKKNTFISSSSSVSFQETIFYVDAIINVYLLL